MLTSSTARARPTALPATDRRGPIDWRGALIAAAFGGRLVARDLLVEDLLDPYVSVNLKHGSFREVSLYQLCQTLNYGIISGIAQADVKNISIVAGDLVGFDLDDTAFIPVATALEMFNGAELQEIDLVAASTEAIPEVVENARRILTDRHRGDEDFTIITQTEMLGAFDRVIGIITVAFS